MAVERLLFRAGRQGYTYPEILEVRRGSLRILMPSPESKRRVRIISAFVSLAYVFIAGPLLGAVALGLMANLGGVVAGAAAAGVFFPGAFRDLGWWVPWGLPPPIRRETATRWPGSATTGILRAMSARFSRADVTTPTVVAVPTDTISGSDVLMPSTLSSSGTPTTRSSRLTSTVIFIKISGRLAGGPTTRPTRPSAFVSTGSRFVPIAMSPPGRTSFREDPPV